MFIDQSSPFAHALITLNGELIGYLIEADTDAGYVIQQHPELGRRRLEGKVELWSATAELIYRRSNRKYVIRSGSR